MIDLCKWRHILGEEKKGFHEERLFSMARNDLLGTIFIAICIALYFKQNILLTILVIFLFGQLLHVIFCVDTAVTVGTASPLPAALPP